MHMPTLLITKEPTKQESRSWWSWGRKNVSHDTIPAPEATANLLEPKNPIAINEIDCTKENLGKKITFIIPSNTYSSASRFKLRMCF